MSTKTKLYQFAGSVITEKQLGEILRGYIPTAENAQIVSGLESTDGGISVTMKDGMKVLVPISQAKEFETVEYDKDTCLLRFLDQNGEDVYDPVHIEGGSGGSSSVTYSISFKNLSDSRSFSVAQGKPAIVKVQYSSVDEDGYDDGPGVGTVFVGGIRKDTINIVQGENSIDVSKYLSSGSNTVKIKVENTDGLTKSIPYTINVVALSVTTTLSQFGTYSGDTAFYYRPVGTGSKTVHFIMDGEEIGTAVTESSGNSFTYTIPAQTHGGHIFECYVSAEIDDVTIRSDSIYLGMIWVESGNVIPTIVMLSNVETLTEGEYLSLPYMVYDPVTETPTVTCTIFNDDGTVYSAQQYTVDGTAQKWVPQDYPTGNIEFRISVGDVYASTTVTISESDIQIETITESLVFDFNPKGRTNQEDEPGNWSSGDIVATFSEVGFAESDGWLIDDSGNTMLRILPGGEMNIPYTFFASDKRDAGATIEVEMATHNVRDYDSTVISCLSGSKGIKIASQYAKITSEQSEVSMQFVEDKRIRVSFVVEPKNLTRLIYVYVNGIGCGAIQYPEDDNFAQNPAVGITIGAESSGIDIYRIVMYETGLSDKELTNNFIADRPTLKERVDAYRRNDVLNDSGEVVIDKLPATLPYMIISCPELPQFKGDKKTCTITYVNISDDGRSFTATNVQIDVQGTSSSGYHKKNFKEKFKEGVIYTSTGTTSDGYAIREGDIEVEEICMKADVASSDNANNVELVGLYNDICPHKTDAQLADPRKRLGIAGVPCVIFWNNTDTGATTFWGKYNLNNEKANHEVYGLVAGCESWEIGNNTSTRVRFKSSDFSTLDWMNDFEARYPEDNTDITNLQRMVAWVVSTDRDAVNTEEEKQARLDKFVAEFEEYFIKDAMIFYYVFTELFLMVDNRAKNFFPTTYDSTHWMPLPYDMDTAMGINNEGALVFEYDLEDTDVLDGKDVFNAKDSTLWCNIRDGFPTDVRNMYSTLRSMTGTLFTYEEVTTRFKNHQSVWPEMIWNKDAYVKYIEPLLANKDGSYLSMFLGPKESQRDWWLFNAFKYRDSKYMCGDATKYYITIRCYNAAPITVTSYSHIWHRIQYDGSVGATEGYILHERGKRNVAKTFECPMSTLNDTPVYLYSADRLSDIGDLSPLKVGWGNFSMAPKLQRLKLGDGSEGYENPNLETVQIGNNELMIEADVRNCPKLKQPIDFSGCIGIERIYAGGTSLTGITLPIGGKLKYLELPNTVTNLTIRNHKQFQTLDCAGYGNLTTLRLENTPNIPVEHIIANATSLNRVRLIGMEWTATDENSLKAVIDKLESCGGMDASAGNTDKAVVNGRVHIGSISGDLLNRIYTNFPELVVVINGVASYLVQYIGADGSVLYRQTVSEGGNAVDPVTAGHIDTPTKPGTDDIRYAYSGWSSLPTNVRNNISVTAQFVATYAVRFYNGENLINTQWIVGGTNAVDPVTSGAINAPTKASTAQYTYAYSGWDKSLSNITGATNIYAQFTSTVRKYTVKFYNDGVLLETHENIPYGGSATYTGTTPVKNVSDSADYEFTGWSPSGTNITGDTNCYAQYRYNGLISVKLVERTIAGEYTNNTVKEVGNYAFYSYSSLTAVKFTEATTIGNTAFTNCSSLTSVSFPAATYIGKLAFYDCRSLTTANFPAATTIGASAFAHCTSLTTANFPAAANIDTSAFSSCTSLTTANFPVATNIKKYAFDNCRSLVSLDIPMVETIGQSAFNSCTSLTSLSLPAVTSITMEAFTNCRKLTALYLGNSTVATLANANAFTNTPMSNSTYTGAFGSIYVPASLVAAYKSATNWGTYADRITAIVE